MTGEWSELFLGLIAAATLVIALIQVGAVVALLRVGRRAQQVAGQVQDVVATVQQEIRPLVAKANAIADEAARTAALASGQAQKLDQLVADLSRRVEETAAIVQEAIVTPAREGIAIVAALKAGLGVLRRGGDVRPRHRRHADEEDPLFIG